MALKLIAVVIPLGLDTFAVSAALGAAGLPARDRPRISLLMSGFEAGMPLIGLALGAPLGRALGSAADYAAIAVLIVIGLYIALADEDQEEAKFGRFVDLQGWGAILLGLSISLDELGIGFTLGLLGLPIAPVIAAVAVQALLFSQVGFRLGSRLSHRAREGTERLAGVVLVGLGTALLLGKL
jgi:manganese efflux pump family protein